MSQRLTESDWERIETFANTPSYQRKPEMLLPPEAPEAADAVDAVEED